MKGSLSLGKYFGINVYLHWSFFLIFLFVFYRGVVDNLGLVGTLAYLAFIIGVFVCVVLHEYGHALTARRYGVDTKDISLYPIGGIARLSRIPEVPMQEFWIAVAGPAVNVLIALLLVPIIYIISKSQGLTLEQALMGGFENPSFLALLSMLMLVNILLVVFNMIPAFPMDGGRVLRALLAIKLPRPRATAIASFVGKGFAITFIILGIFVIGDVFLAFIGLFIFWAASAENQMVATNSTLGAHTVADVLRTRYTALTTSTTLAEAAKELLAGAEQDFVVMENGEVAGVLNREFLMHALSQAPDTKSINDYVNRSVPVAGLDQPITQVFELMRANGVRLVPVVNHKEFVGVLDFENLNEFIMLKQARQKATGNAKQALPTQTPVQDSKPVF